MKIYEKFKKLTSKKGKYSTPFFGLVGRSPVVVVVLSMDILVVRKERKMKNKRIVLLFFENGYTNSI